MLLRLGSITVSVLLLIFASLVPFTSLQRAGSKHSRLASSYLVSLFSCFACGIFLSTCFLGLMKHLKKSEVALKAQLNVTSERTYTYDMLIDANLITMAGFLLIVLIEQSVYFCAPAESPTAHVELESTKRSRGASSRGATLNSDSDGQPLVDLSSHSEDSADDDIGEISFRAPAPPHEHHHSHGAGGHSHHVLPAKGSVLQSLVLLLALSSHSVFEGVALCAQKSDSGFLKLLISIMLHEVLCSFAFGVKLASSGVPRGRALLYILCLSLALPAGMLLMEILTSAERTSSNVCRFVMEGLAAGTFIYVACVEMLAPELGHTPSREGFVKSVALTLGAITFFGFTYLVDV